MSFQNVSATARSVGHLRINAVERRKSPRISIPFAATVNGHDSLGNPFGVTTMLDNLSGRGFYLRLLQCVVIGDSIDIILNLAPTNRTGAAGGQVRIKGFITRIDQKPGQVFGVAVAFKRPQFL